jgi:hypothetical protein
VWTEIYNPNIQFGDKGSFVYIEAPPENAVKIYKDKFDVDTIDCFVTSDKYLTCLVNHFIYSRELSDELQEYINETENDIEESTLKFLCNPDNIFLTKQDIA